VDGLTGTDMTELPDEEKQRLVKEACQAAYAHEFIEELPNVRINPCANCLPWDPADPSNQGYETYIGERGASLSGGQRQRIVIARSIISNPKVLLLDEATSTLDPNAERVVQLALNNVAKGRTMVVIAHRLSTIRNADNIVVMVKGETVEQGTHEQLINLGGAYARLVKVQDLGKKSGTTDEGGQDDKSAAVADFDVSLARASTTSTEAGVSCGKEDECGLFIGLVLILKEQKSLWWLMAIIFACCIAGGDFLPIILPKLSSCSL
jgi:ATP-binding cassette, subfamily B (MDR/TAP), member 1